MRKVLFLSVALCFAATLLLCGAAYSDDKPAAMIVKVSGTVKVKRGGKEVAVTGKVSLKWGDKVSADKGGSATVLFSSGKSVTVTSSLDITEANAAVAGKKVSAGAGLSGSVVSSSGKKDLKAKGGVAGATRSAGAANFVQIVSYLNTNTINTRPVFAWESSSPAETTHLELMNEDGDVVWKTDTKDTVASYPENMTALESGKEYTLNVKSVIEGDTAEMSSTFFVVDKDAAEEISKTVDQIKTEYADEDNLVVQHMLLSEYYKQKELLMDSIGELKKLIALDANDVDSHIALAELYVKIGDKPDALKEQGIIDKLQKDAAPNPLEEENTGK